MAAMQSDPTCLCPGRLSKDAHEDLPGGTSRLDRGDRDGRRHATRRVGWSQTAGSRTSYVSFISYICAVLFLFTVVCNGEEYQRPYDRSLARRTPLRPRSAPPLPLRNLQVSSPVYTPSDSKCEMTLMTYTFGQSYGKPFVGERRLHLHLDSQCTTSLLSF